MTGGILTLAVAGASMPASASEPAAAETTLELPTVSETLATTAAQTADATQQAAQDYQVRATQDAAVVKARSLAKKAKAEAERKAKEAAARKAAAERAAQKAAQERAARSAERATLSTASTTAAPSNATGSAASVIDFLRAQLGKAYVMGATGPSAYDCSGLTQAAFRQVGISLPRVSQDQSTAGTQVSLSALQPGDILYWGGAGSAYHVGVYVGGDKFIGAQNSSTGIVERDLSYDPPSGAVRVL